MKQERKKAFPTALWTFAAFLLWTAAVRFLDVQPIGPQNATVGFATLNRFVQELTGVHMSLYTLTDRLSLIPLGFAAGFALMGLTQWIRRKHLFRVDYSILVLGGFYAVVLAVYGFFEVVVINHRPVLIDGVLEASYPSSTTVLVLCVMSTAMSQLKERLRNPVLKRCAASLITVFMLLMLTGRLLSGVHWFTDIIGGILLSAGLVLLYHAIRSLKPDSR